MFRGSHRDPQNNDAAPGDWVRNAQRANPESLYKIKQAVRRENYMVKAIGFCDFNHKRGRESIQSMQRTD